MADVFDKPDFRRASQERLTSIGGAGVSSGGGGATTSVKGIAAASAASGSATVTGASSGSVFGFFLKKLNIGM
ncbi:hypothetical protein IMCC9480_1733 [Oxalobacteraceae bacterium IMCC9480]|nr:hypothetical protein IMCC9480_1733 [Oxalobacteraceae bacterium IMCC9480]